LSEGPREIRASLLVLGVFALALTAPGFLTDRVFHYGDWTVYFVPLRDHLVAAWRSGDLFPFWWSGMLGGFPVVANPQYGLFYPPHWILSLLPLGFGLTLLTWAHMVWGGLGVSVLLRGRGARRATAILGGVVYIGAGPMVSVGSAVNLALALAWLPWVLHWFPLGVEATGVRARRAAAGALAAMFLAGGLEALIWTVLLLPFWTYGSSRIFLGSGPGLGLAPPLRRRVGPVLTGLIVVGGMALLLAAVQLLPTLELIGNSTRLEGVNPVEAARFVATPGRATGLLLPWVTWDPETMTSWLNLTGDVRAHFLPSLFLGATALALALLGWTRAPRGERAVAATLGVLALLFGLGSDLPLIGTVARLVPGSSHYRFDEKYLVLFTLSIAYFSAWGFEAQLNRRRLARLQAGMRERRWGSGLLVGVGIVGLAAAALLFLVGAERASFLLRWGGQQVWSAQSDAMASFHARQVSGLLLTSLVALACGLLLTVRAARRIPAATAAVLVIGLVGLELGLAGARFYRTTSLSKLRQPAAPASVVLGEGNGARAARWVLFDDESASLEHLQNPDGQLDLYRSWLVPNLGPFQGVPTFDGSSALRLRAQAHAEFSWRGAADRTRVPFAGALGVRYLLLSRYEDVTAIQEVPGLYPLYPTTENPPDSTTSVPPLVVFRNELSLQPLQLVFDWRSAPDAEEAIRKLRSLGLRPDRQVVLSPGPAMTSADSSRAPTPPAAGLPTEEPDWQIEVLERRNDGLRIRVTTSLPGLLIRSENPYPGWRVSLNGQPVELWSANAVLQAVVIPAGTSELYFAFRPGLIGPGALLTLLGILWVIAPGLRARLGRFRPAAAGSAPLRL
jgi:hypothetical protein